VVADFGFTMTKFHANGEKLPNSHGLSRKFGINNSIITITLFLDVIDSYSGMSPAYKESNRELINKYHQVEFDPSLPLEVKIMLMSEWFNAKHELMIQNNLHKEDFALMVKESTATFR